MSVKMPVVLSNRHVHLLPEDIEKLFGPCYELTVDRKLFGKDFVAKETVTVVGPKGKLEKIRVLGPARRYTQVELLKSDCIKLGLNAPIAETGDLVKAAEVTMVGTAGEITKKCAIIALRHIHFRPETAAQLNVQDGDFVSVKAEGERGLVFNRVLARVAPQNIDVIHIDFEEGNAADLKNNDVLEIMKP
jgi:putative phosphotransacetylase